MKTKDLLKNYYVHETILEKINYNIDNKQISINVKYCEWQLEENINDKNIIGYNLTFFNVSNISSMNIFELKNEYILDILFKKDKQVVLCMDVEPYKDLSFNYESLIIEDVKI